MSFTETSMVLLSRGGQVKLDIFDALLVRFDIELVPVDLAQAVLARQAFRRFGKGRNRASLNLGDCFFYALSKYYVEPLLFKSNDFTQTDVLLA